MSDHEHSGIACDVPQDDCIVWDTANAICSDWDRETIKRQRQANAGWKNIARLLFKAGLSTEETIAIAGYYFESHERPTTRPSKLKSIKVI